MSTVVDRPVLTRDAAEDAARRLRVLMGSNADRIVIEHNARAVLQIANNAVRDGIVGAELSIHFPAVMNTVQSIRVGMNQLDDATLRAIAAQLTTLLPPPPPPDDDPDELATLTQMLALATYAKQHPPIPVALWHDSTVAAMTEPPALASAVIPAMEAAKMVGAATLALSARATYFNYDLGMSAWAEDTDAELSVTARLLDGTASGWGGQANRDVSALVMEKAVVQAIALAEQGRNPQTIEPGRYTTILGSAAVGQLARMLSADFYFAYSWSHVGNGPFSDPWSPSRTKLGQRVMDERLRLVSDPADPDGGFIPIYELDGYGQAGYPLPKTVWVENGVLTNMMYNPGEGANRRKPWTELPFSLRIEAMPGVETLTVEEMIAQCDHGIYVNRFSHLKLLDQQTAMCTGTTRDGCFLVEHGKISRSIRNLRFMDTPFQVLTRVQQIGKAERMAYGYTLMDDIERRSLAQWPAFGRMTRWPRVPMIVPPLMVQDFNFTALANAV